MGTVQSKKNIVKKEPYLVPEDMPKSPPRPDNRSESEVSESSEGEKEQEQPIKYKEI